MKSIQSYVQGGKHISKGIPCEDRTFSITKNQVMSIALADGAGNQKYTHSGQGAECVTRVAANFLCDNFDNFYVKEDEEELKKVFIAVLRKALSALAEELKLDSIIRLSSTVLAVAVKGNKYIACHLGDGMIGALKVNGTEPFSLPNNGEFANETYFVPSPGAEENLKIKRGIVEDILAFFLMSDGTADYIYEDYEKKFSPAALKMTGMLYEENGSDRLRETIQKYMIEPNSTSDDCSFIVLEAQEITPKVKMELFGLGLERSVTNVTKIESASSVKPVNLGENKDFFEEDQTEKLNVAERVNGNAVTPYVKPKSRKKEKAIITIISIICFVAAAVVALIIFFTGNSDKKNNDDVSKDNQTEVFNGNETETGLGDDEGQSTEEEMVDDQNNGDEADGTKDNSSPNNSQNGDTENEGTVSDDNLHDGSGLEESLSGNTLSGNEATSGPGIDIG